MEDIRPPKRPLSQTTPQPARPMPAQQPPQQPQPITEAPTLQPKKKRHVWRWVIIGVVALIILLVASAFAWYRLSLRPVSSGDTSRRRVKVEEGMSPAQIGELLRQNNLIRSTYAFDIYTRLSGTRSSLQAGSYSLSPSEPLATIVNDIVSGKVDQFSITFLPGATVKEDKAALVKSGYSQSEVDAAFKKQYDSPLFATKPASADLEGYIYGETYQFNSDATVEQILAKTFDQFYQVVKQHDLINGFKKQGLSLYQGITLASIIQREVATKDQPQVAQIFLKRLKEGMPLGSDVTYHYAADKLGVAPSPDLDSPYNTRIHKGLPPGPIAAPGLSALEAVAHPASGDYLYFLSGDDGKTYFAKTEAEHQANIDNYCKIKCATP